jgi:MBG domain-containing protein
VPGGVPIDYSLTTSATPLSNVAGSPYSIDVTLGYNPNYSVKVPADNGVLSVVARPATVRANPKTKTYSDPNPPLDATVTGQVEGGDVIRFSLSTLAVQCSNVAGSPYSIDVTLGSNPNYSVTVPPDNGTLTIEPKFATVKANPKTKTYGDENPPLDGTVTGEVPGCEPIHYSLSTAAVKCSNVAGSPYAINVTLGSNPNYSVKVPADNGTLTILARFATVKANAKTKTYGDDNPPLDATVTGEVPGCDPIHYSLSTPAVKCSNVAGSPYPIDVTLGSNPNYSVKVPADNGTLTIQAKLATVKANAKTKTYGDDNPVLDATVTGEVAGCEPIHYSLSTPAVKCSNVAGSPYSIDVTLGSNPNYSVKVPADNGMLTIVPKSATVMANSKTKTYGDDNPPLDATVTGEVAGCEAIHYSLSTPAAKCSDVASGPYPINLTLGANPNYSVTKTDGALTVQPRFATVKANCKTRTYGDPNPPLDATVTGEVAGCEPIHFTLSTPATMCSPVTGSPYPIYVTLGSNPNYSVKVPADNCVLTIVPKFATVRANPKTKTYGDDNPLLDATVIGEVPGCEPIHYSLTTPAVKCSDVTGSPYPINVTLGANPNYSVKVPADNGTLAIEPRFATVKANCKTRTYGDPNPPLDATVVGEVPGCEPIHYTLSTDAVKCSNVAGSPYPINVTLGSNPNYSIKVPADNCVLTIVPKLAIVKPTARPRSTVMRIHRSTPR